MSLMELRVAANDAWCEHLGSKALERYVSLSHAREAYMLDPRTLRFLDAIRSCGYLNAHRGFHAVEDGGLY